MSLGMRFGDEQGMAMIVSVLVLLLLTAIGIAAIEHSGSEFAAGGRSRHITRVLHAADAGLEVVAAKLAGATLNVSPTTLTLTNGTTVQSGDRNATSPQPLKLVGYGPPPEGYGLNVGSGFSTEIYRPIVTANSASGGMVELESQLGRLGVE
ncbi:MAG: hypothetical protein HRU00_18015 [Myxococcales bacterium]|nr:hypothetical protein [Myxococcales bacterium]